MEAWSTQPVAVPGLTGVTAIAAAGETAFALKTDGTLWAWGADDKGQLGSGEPAPTDEIGNQIGQAVPSQVAVLTEVTAVAVSGETAFAATRDGAVWSWGAVWGSTTAERISPVRVGQVQGVTALAAGNATWYALTSAGQVWAAGSGDHGALGDGVAGPHVVAAPQLVPGLSTVTGISAGGATAYAVTAEGTAWEWGDARALQPAEVAQGGSADIATPTAIAGLPPVQTLVADTPSSLGSPSTRGYAITTDHNVWAWGELTYCSSHGVTASAPHRLSSLTSISAMADVSCSALAVASP